MPQINRMRVLILDNYDSFTYNLFDYIASFDVQVDVFRNDEISIAEVEKYSHIVCSPGPGLPNDAGIMPKIIAEYAESKSILGVCLGMQGLALHFGGELYNLSDVRHGVQVRVKQTYSSRLFTNVPPTFDVGLYHSWAVRDLPSELRVTSLSDEQVIMSFEHTHLPIYGVQFHPESVLTPDGKKIIGAFLGR